MLHRALNVEALWQLKSGSHRTGGIHGVIQSLGNLARKFKLQKGVVVAWDLGTSTQRRAIYPEYKDGRSNRDPTSPDYNPSERDHVYIWSRKYLHTFFLPLTGCLSVQISDIEADDIIGWVCRNIEHEKGRKIIIVSTDGDFLQLVSENTHVWNPIKRVMHTMDSIIEEEGEYLVLDKYQQQLNLMHAMVGDGSDNIPGVKGLGWKYARKLSHTLLTDGEESLEKDYAYVQKYLENKEAIERNLKLVDLTIPLWPQYEKEILDYIVKYSQLHPPVNSESVLISKMKQLQLSRCIELVPDLIQANHSSDFKSRLSDIAYRLSQG